MLPILNTGEIASIQEYDCAEVGYYHNEIIKSVFTTNREYFVSSNSVRDLIHEVVCVAQVDFEISISDELMDCFLNNYERYLGLDIFHLDAFASEMGIEEEYDILLSYFNTVTNIYDYDDALNYTNDFMAIVSSTVESGNPDMEISVSIINSAISVAIYSRTLWNLYECDPALSDTYPAFNMLSREWE